MTQNTLKTTIAFLLIFSLLPITVEAQDALQEVTVNPGDTMWSIANRYLKDPQRWPEIAKYNDFPTPDPTLALPGSKIRIPVVLIKDEYQNAQLIKLVAEVRVQRKGEAAWKPAEPNMLLHYEDGLRTMAGAEARVRFPTREVVQINENSYVVLRPEKILQEVKLLEGTVRASRAKVIMPGGTIVKPLSASEYQAKVREDQTEVVFVYKGQVNVTAQGKTVTVKEGFGTQVPKSAPPMAPQPLPTFKDYIPTAPPAAASAASTGTVSITPSVIKPLPSAPRPASEDGSKSKSVLSNNLLVGYRLQLASDNQFRNIVLEKSEKIGVEFDIRKEKIPDGNYFMRVSFSDAFGVAGPFSNPAAILKDTVPPEITDLVPSDGQTLSGGDGFCEVAGTVKDATLLSVNDEVIFLGPTGRFSKFVALKEGINSIKILARDGAGNQTVIERKVIYSSR